MPFVQSVPRLAPIAGAAEVKDQRLAGAHARDWKIAGNGAGESIGPDGRPLEFQFLLGGEGDFDLAGYLRLMHAQGSRTDLFEASVQCQARPDYTSAAASTTYRWMRAAWQSAKSPHSEFAFVPCHKFGPPLGL